MINNSEPSFNGNICWCEGTLKQSVHQLYAQCEICGTHVLNGTYTYTELSKFYSLSEYWHKHQVAVSGFPPIEDRAKSDFRDRIPFWYELVHQFVSKPESLLEIGCAHGGFLHYCREHGVKNVAGVEVDEATCEFARTFFDLNHVYSGLFPNVKLPNTEFDVIVGFDVIEHFADPITGISAISNLLSDKGTFIFQTPCYRGESNTWQQFRPTEHLYLYNESSIKQLFNNCGLEITNILPGFFPDDMFVIGHKIKKNILLIRTDSIGDNILASAMLPHIHYKYPDSTITLVCQSHIAELYESSPYINNIITFNRTKALNNSVYCKLVVEKIKSSKPDRLLNAVYSRDKLNEIFSLGSGAQEIIGIDGDTSNEPENIKAQADKLYSKLIKSPGDLKLEIDRHRDFLAGLGIIVSELKPQIWLNDNDKQFAERVFKKYALQPDKTIVLFAGAQHQVRIFEHYGKALAEICEKNDYSVIALGTDADKFITKLNLNDIPTNTVDLCGTTSIRQSAAIISRCRLAVGAETALAHIACAVDTPNVILLGGGHFGRFMPYSPFTSVVCLPLECYGCNWKCRYDRPYCIKTIAPETVFNAVNESLQCHSEKPRVHVQQEISWEQSASRPAYKETSLNLINVPAYVYLHK